MFEAAWKHCNSRFIELSTRNVDHLKVNAREAVLLGEAVLPAVL